MAIALVCGAVANKPLNGGNAWTRLQWLLGLRKLGFQVHLIEEISAETCVDDEGHTAPFERSANLDYFRLVAAQFELASAMSLVYQGGNDTWGLSYGELGDLVADADLLINIGGHLRGPLFRGCHGPKVYFDDDPGYTQLWQETGQGASRLDGHDHFYTVGANIGTPSCTIPTCGIAWRPLSPFVVLDCWPPVRKETETRFTTVASWRGAYGPVEVDGVPLGLKAHEFRKFAPIPELAPGSYEIALDIHPADRRDVDMLVQHGWSLRDPRAVVPDPLRYRSYVQASAAEFSAAQGIYVQTRSGWFSDRTACYLASGKPVLVQDTGFGKSLPVGDGLLSFQGLDEAVHGAERILGNYSHHARAARAVCEQFFASDTVLGGLLNEIGVTP